MSKMKLIIDISEEAYELLKSKSELDNIAESIIANGTPITEGEWISRRWLLENMGSMTFPDGGKINFVDHQTIFNARSIDGIVGGAE